MGDAMLPAHVERDPVVSAPRLHLTAPAEAVEPLQCLLTAAEVGRILGVRSKRVYELGIPAVRLSQKCLRWRPSEVEAWLQSRSEGDPR
jgi:predicted DNA-binding transcriptional regulator AlpA